MTNAIYQDSDSVQAFLSLFLSLRSFVNADSVFFNAKGGFALLVNLAHSVKMLQVNKYCFFEYKKN